MSKFKIKVKLTGFELEIEGDRQDIPALTRSLSKQLGGLISPPSADMFEDADVVPDTPLALPESPASKPAPKKKRSATPKPKSNATSKGDAAPLELDGRNIESKYSSPRQQWATYDKLMWLLYVLEKENQLNAVTSIQLKDTFNKYFKISGEVTAQNVSDLKNKVNATPSLLGKDTSTDPVTWYIKDAGIKYVENLISDSNSAE